MEKFINAENLQYALNQFRNSLMKEWTTDIEMEQANKTDIENLFK